MKKREMIEKVLGQYKPKADWMTSPFLVDLNTLADQVIVIECEVEHAQLPGGNPKTFLFAGEDAGSYWSLNAVGSGHHGTDGEEVVVMVFKKP